MKRSAGFSLVELLTVVAIIAILAAIAIPQYRNYLSRTRAGGAAAELSGLRNAVNACIAERQTVSGCSAGNHGVPDIATFSTTKNVVALTAISDGRIQAITGATAPGGSPYLTWDDSPSLPAGGSNIVWSNSGTVCDVARGLRTGQGDCP